MSAQRNYGLSLAILAVIGLTASASLAGSKTPATQPAASPASATTLSPSLSAPSVATQTPTSVPATGPAEPAAREIPLEKVWAYQMPGTRSMDMPLLDDGKTYATADGKMIGEALGSFCQEQSLVIAESIFSRLTNSLYLISCSIFALKIA